MMSSLTYRKMDSTNKPLYFLDGTLFATDYVRIVHGGRGDYIELTKEQIVVELVSKMGHKIPDVITHKPFYYYFLIPSGRDEKIYWQIRTVSYADYKTGMYYIDPSLVTGWEKPKPVKQIQKSAPPLF